MNAGLPLPVPVSRRSVLADIFHHHRGSFGRQTQNVRLDKHFSCYSRELDVNVKLQTDFMA